MVSLLSIDDHIHLATEEIHNDVQRFTVPLFAVDRRDRPELFASAVCVEVSGKLILMTARHAIDEIRKSGSAVHVGGKKISTITQEIVTLDAPGDDGLDFAFCVLSPEFAEAQNIQSLPFVRIFGGSDITRSHIKSIHGYPITKNGQVKRANPQTNVFTTYAFTFAGASPEEAIDFLKFGKSSATHFALTYDKHARGESGAIEKPPKPKGMSGGGLWVTPNSFVTKDTLLAGICVEFYESHRLVFALRISRVLDVIQKQFQHL